MITDDLQDQAALYALGALTAEEQVAFEEAMKSNAELRNLVREMREAAASLAQSVPQHQPPEAARQRVLRAVAVDQPARSAGQNTTSFNWLPWAIAALLTFFCGVLALDRAHLRRELADARSADPLLQAAVITLASPTGDHPDAKATVAWQADRQSGTITIRNMSPAGKDRDYQLWAVDANRKDPINAGVIHVDANGTAHVRFKPDQIATQVKAFAISLEREGGVPKREGPIVMIGNA